MLRSIILSFILVSCASNSIPSRLPDSNGQTVDIQQWHDYCARDGQTDPACKDK